MKVKTPTGFRDFNAEESIFRKEMIEKIEQKFRLYGYAPIETPALEFTETLSAKSGDEIKKQLFNVENEQISLRFDLTVPLARFIASNLEIPKPFKRYCIANVWRNEEPQKARYREFLQCDADIIGVKEQNAEIELLSLAKDVLQTLGFSIKNARILLNNRKFLQAYAEAKKIEDSAFFFRALDKIDKIGEKEVEDILAEKYGKEKSKEIMQELCEKRNNGQKLQLVKKYSEEAYLELNYIIGKIEGTEISLFLVRGLDYYTGPIFEIKLSNEIGTVAGGGRYDILAEMYGSKNPACGISFGLERLYYLKMQEKFERKRTYAKIYVCFIKENFDYALEFANALRKENIAVDMNLSARSLKAQLDYANSLGFEYVAILGDKEKAEKTAVLKNMKTKEENSLAVKEIIKKLKN